MCKRLQVPGEPEAGRCQGGASGMPCRLLCTVSEGTGLWLWTQKGTIASSGPQGLHWASELPDPSTLSPISPHVGWQSTFPPPCAQMQGKALWCPHTDHRHKGCAGCPARSQEGRYDQGGQSCQVLGPGPAPYHLFLPIPATGSASPH